jgi:hypothetical protein
MRNSLGVLKWKKAFIYWYLEGITIKLKFGISQLCLIAGGFFRLPSGHTVSILDAWPDLLELPSGKRLGSY